MVTGNYAHPRPSGTGCYNVGSQALLATGAIVADQVFAFSVKGRADDGLGYGPCVGNHGRFLFDWCLKKIDVRR